MHGFFALRGGGDGPHPPPRRHLPQGGRLGGAGETNLIRRRGSTFPREEGLGEGRGGIYRVDWKAMT